MFQPLSACVWQEKCVTITSTSDPLKRLHQLHQLVRIETLCRFIIHHSAELVNLNKKSTGIPAMNCRRPFQLSNAGIYQFFRAER